MRELVLRKRGGLVPWSVGLEAREDPSMAFNTWAELMLSMSHNGVRYSLPNAAQEEIGADFAGLSRSGFKGNGVVFDPWSFRRSAELLEAEGFPMVEFPQSPERMASASANLYRLIEAGELVHNGDPVLRAHVMAGATKETERGWRLVKDPKLPRPIDALIALAVAALPAVSLVREQEPFFAFA